MKPLLYMIGLMRQIETVARAEGAKRAVSVAVWLGALSHMPEQHFAEHFSQAAAGSIAKGAWLDVTVSRDMSDTDAQGIRLESVEVES